MSEPTAATRWLFEQLRFDRVGQKSILFDTPDWEQVVAAARQERLAALVLDRATVLPDDTRARLEELHLQTRVQNAILLMQLEQWLTRFESENIPTIVLKGAALIASVYARTTLRPMSDVDMLVPRADFERAGRLLQAAGFTPFREVTGDSAQTIRTQILWLSPKLLGGIELHWHLVDSGYYANRVPIEW
ncbi:MAG: nucleotidyltransferase family protein, partial [Chloroflexota bacterium]